MRLLGIDYGSKRVGIALGDTESRIASPWAVFENEGSLALLAKIHDVATQEQAKAIVVGVPHSLRKPHEENAQLRSIRRFIEELKGIGLEVHEIDEALTSRLAARQVADMGQKGKRDDLAAAVILQTWLDRNAH